MPDHAKTAWSGVLRGALLVGLWCGGWPCTHHAPGLAPPPARDHPPTLVSAQEAWETAQAVDLMAGAPSTVSPKQLRELHLKMD